MTTPGLTRFDHLTDLACDRLATDPPDSDPELFAACYAHLAACEACRARFARVLDEQRAVILPSAAVRSLAARSTPGPAPLPALRAKRWPLVAGVVMALAASLFLVLRPSTPDADLVPVTFPSDDPRSKGAPLSLQIHVNDGSQTRTVGDGDDIHPGERAAFAVRTTVAGHLLIFGWDDSGKRYPIWPADSDPVHAAPFAATPTWTAIPAAVRFDDALGDEHLIAVFCPTTFALSDLAPAPIGSARDSVPLPPGCSAHLVVLHKRLPGP